MKELIEKIRTELLYSCQYGYNYCIPLFDSKDDAIALSMTEEEYYNLVEMINKEISNGTLNLKPFKLVEDN